MRGASATVRYRAAVVEGVDVAPEHEAVLAAASPVGIRLCPRLLRSWLRGREDDGWWVRPSVLGLLGLAGALYLWGLGRTGWGYGIYSAAVEAGTRSLKAALFGSLDPANFITVDKPPAALWVMEVPAKLFGVTPWAIMAPQALEGVGTVGAVYLAVRRWSGPGTGLVAGLVTALTPVCAAIFRFNNPDALMVMLVTWAAYATVRTIDDGDASWSLVAGSLVGLAFLAKMLEAFLVVPGLAAAYLLAAPGSLGRRIRHVGYGGAALVTAAGWWVGTVQLTPASSRPYIGSTGDNSLLSLIFGYNGFNRFGAISAAHLPGPGFIASSLRLFGTEMGSQVSWLLPAVLVLMAATVVTCRGRDRFDRTRASIVLWGTWLVVMGGVFSYSQGMVNAYYTVALAPAVGALVGVGANALWSRRYQRQARWVMGGAVALTAVWAFNLLDRDAPWAPWLRDSILVVGLAAGACVLAWHRLGGYGRLAVVVGIVFVALAGPGAYSLGPVVNPPVGVDPYAAAPTGGHEVHWAGPGGGQVAISRPSRELVRMLVRHARSYRWIVATVGSDPAAGYELATGDAAMAIGGWSGTDPVPTLARFERLVALRKVHYFIPSSNGFAAGKSYYRTDANQITRWVERHCRRESFGGIELYNLAHVGEKSYSAGPKAK